MNELALKRNYQLQLPNSFVDIDSEGMEYVDGGYFVDIANSTLAKIVDASLFLFGGAKLAQGISRAFAMYGRYEVAVAISYVALNVSNWLGANNTYTKIFNVVNVLLGILCNFTAGNAVAYVLDSIDVTGKNGRVQF